jgi:hypothetical protein
MARGKPKIETLDADGFALIADPSLLQQPADHLDRFPDAGQRLAIGHAMLGFDLHLVARPDAEDKPSARQIIEGRGRHGDRRRGADKDAGDAGSQQNARGLSGACRQHGELVAAMPFCHPCRLIAELLGEFYAVDDLGRGRAAGERDTGSGHINLHRML